MYDVKQIARVSPEIAEKTVEEWQAELPNSDIYPPPTTYIEVAHRLVELIRTGHWKYVKYVKQDIVVTELSSDGPLSLTNGEAISRQED